MKYRNKKVKDVSSEQLLFELLQRNGTQIGPVQSTFVGSWLASTIGIGNDHTADIRLPEEDLEELHKIVAE